SSPGGPGRCRCPLPSARRTSRRRREPAGCREDRRSCSLALLLNFLAGLGRPVDERVERLDAEHDVIAVEHVVGVQLIRRERVDVGKVLNRLPRRHVFTADDEQDLLAVADLAQERASTLRRRGLTRDEFGDHVDALVARPVGEGSAQGGGLHLLGGALAVVARLRAVDGATAGELRRTGRALTCAAGALLAVRLLATAADV